MPETLNKLWFHLEGIVVKDETAGTIAPGVRVAVVVVGGVL